MRRISGDLVLYSHADESHTPSGEVAISRLPGQNGSVEYGYDAIGRTIKIEAAHFRQSVPSDGFDAAGNLVKFETEGIPYQFTYDDHFHIQSEDGHTRHTYRFDSLSNRVAKDGTTHVHNSLNQLQNTGQEKFIYDLNGNMVERILSNEVIHYSYDALDRLISVDQESGLSAFGLRYYDPKIGRWITPDPAGFADGPNLYAYVHNSPLLYWDQFGLFKTFGLAGLVGNFLGEASPTFYNYSQVVKGAQEPDIRHVEIENKLEEEYNFRQNGSQKPFEKTKTYSLNDLNIINPQTGEPFNLKQASHVGIGFICGIGNTLDDFKSSLAYLGQMSEYDIKGVHCPTYGAFQDAQCYKNAQYNFFAYEGVRELHKMWYQFFKDAPLDATFLMIGHSRGCVYIRNALMSFPLDLRDRIEVIAIAPGGYISRNLCKDVRHYTSTADVVPLLDFMGRSYFKDTITTLSPHPRANQWFDHSFMSPTYSKDIQGHIDDYFLRRNN